MSEYVFFLTKLADESKRSAYEEWVRETDIEAASKLDCVQSYRVVRLEGQVMEDVGAPEYDYLEIIEVTNVDDYKQALVSVDPALMDSFQRFIGSFEVVHGRSVD